MQSSQSLLTPYTLNSSLTLPNRIIMAPMTRAAANPDGTPTDLMADYYARRSAAGLIVTEGTIIHPDARGFDGVPGIYIDEQVQAWRQVTDKVHTEGGRIFCQIWHVGRVTHPHFIGGKLPISASATKMTGKLSRSDFHFGESRAATLKDIHDLIKQYEQAAKYARLAGFDGVEIHGANGYLIDQFLHYHTNLRTDDYGGNAVNMARFALEVVQACGEAIGYERIGLRLSPGAYLNEIVGDVRDAQVFQCLLQSLNSLPIAYLHTGSFDDSLTYAELADTNMSTFLRKNYQGTLVACGSYTAATAEAGIVNKQFDLVAIGRPFIANPDLIELIKNDFPIKTYDRSMLATLY